MHPERTARRSALTPDRDRRGSCGPTRTELRSVVVFWLRLVFFGLIGTWRLVVAGIWVVALFRIREQDGHWNGDRVVLTAVIHVPMLVFGIWCFVAIAMPSSNAVLGTVFALLGISLVAQLWLKRRERPDELPALLSKPSAETRDVE
jgi:hypothetical protein